MGIYLSTFDLDLLWKTVYYLFELNLSYTVVKTFKSLKV